MTARQSRLDIIKAIIQTQEIGSQEELAQALSKEGVNTSHVVTRPETAEGGEGFFAEGPLHLYAA